MRPQIVLNHQFVEYIPDEIQWGTIYVSMEYAIIVHKCCCGCGKEVITPLSPTDWRLMYDGKSISIGPSIGNWSFDCQSHYWIINNKVHWAGSFSRYDIDTVRAYDRLAKEGYFNDIESQENQKTVSGTRGIEAPNEQESYWAKIKKWLFQ